MNKIQRLYFKLKNKYGKPREQWALWCKRPKTYKEQEEILIGAILAQNASWNNAEAAIRNLKSAGAGTLRGLRSLNKKKLARLIKPARFFNSKAEYLHNLAEFVIKNYGSLEKIKKEKPLELREKLLELKGIGPETADSILLYGLHAPVFVIDEYTRRLVKKRKLSHDLSYNQLQKLFQDNLRKNYCLYQDFHALIVMENQRK